MRTAPPELGVLNDSRSELSRAMRRSRSMSWLRRSAALLVMVIAAALSGGAESAASATEQCEAARVRGAFVRFISAYNTTDLPRLDALFAREPDFQWYSAGAPGLRIRSAAYRRDTLLSYFRARARKGDRLRLLSFKFNSNSNGYGNFEYRLERRARDYLAGKPFKLTGKGAAICDDTGSLLDAEGVRFIVMSLGSRDPA
jgi:hypothetical protein